VGTLIRAGYFHFCNVHIVFFRKIEGARSRRALRRSQSACGRIAGDLNGFFMKVIKATSTPPNVPPEDGAIRPAFEKVEADLGLWLAAANAQLEATAKAKLRQPLFDEASAAALKDMAGRPAAVQASEPAAEAPGEAPEAPVSSDDEALMAS